MLWFCARIGSPTVISSTVSSFLTFIICSNKLQRFRLDEFRIIPFILWILSLIGSLTLNGMEPFRYRQFCCFESMRSSSDKWVNYQINIHFRLNSIGFVYQSYTLFRTTRVCHNETCSNGQSGVRFLRWYTGLLSEDECVQHVLLQSLPLPHLLNRRIPLSVESFRNHCIRAPLWSNPHSSSSYQWRLGFSPTKRRFLPYEVSILANSGLKRSPHNFCNRDLKDILRPGCLEL